MPIFVASNIVPRNSGKWPVVEDTYLRGGIRVVADATARDAIYADAAARSGLKIGMLLITANDLRIWQYTATNTWTEIKKATTKTYSFSIPGTIWDIPHNTGSSNFTYTVFDVDGLQILPHECQVLDVNNLRLTFLEEVAGTVTISFNV
jgi:hypothetical protein